VIIGLTLLYTVDAPRALQPKTRVHIFLPALRTHGTRKIGDEDPFTGWTRFEQDQQRGYQLSATSTYSS